MAKFCHIRSSFCMYVMELITKAASTGLYLDCDRQNNALEGCPCPSPWNP